MKQFLFLVILMVCYLPAQMQNADEVTKQCSSIRELVYAGWNNQFADITADQLRTSSGQATGVTWRFINTRYNTNLTWPGSTSSFIEHYEEEADSTRLHSWQYIAEMGNLPDQLAAQHLLHQLNRQIEGCPYLHNDSLRSEFRRLPHDSLPATCPENLEMASLYELPLRDSANKIQHELSIMTGIEKYRQLYRVSLIVEDRRVMKKGN